MGDCRFIPYEPDKPLELAPDIRKWLPEDHLALFISDVVDSLDLRDIAEEYLHLQGRHPAYHPAMMLKLLSVFANGKSLFSLRFPSSRPLKNRMIEK